MIKNIEEKIFNLLTAVSQDESLSRTFRLATTASAICNVAESVGILLKPAELVKYYARLLLEADDETAVYNFDNCSWDASELCWIMKNWRHDES